MAKGDLTAVTPSTDRQVQGKSRKSLQLLQVSTNKQISAESNLGKKAKKISKNKKMLLKAAEKIEVAEKENTPLLRRSKCNITLDSKQNTDSLSMKSSTESVHFVKARKSKRVPKSTKKSSVVKESLNEVQNNFHSSPVKPVATNKGVSEASTMSSAVSDNEAFILTCATPSVHYWTEIAEQRRIALEMALYENESLQDQLVVLKTENSQLKQLIKEAEEFADIVKGVIK